MTTAEKEMLREVREEVTRKNVVKVMLKDEDNWNHIEKYVTSDIKQ